MKQSERNRFMGENGYFTKNSKNKTETHLKFMHLSAKFQDDSSRANGRYVMMNTALATAETDS